MPTAGTLRVGQVAPNTYWVTVSQDGSMAAFDFTTVSAASIVVKKPSGATQAWTTVLSPQTTTGLTATHTLAFGDLDEAGTYTGYLLMTVPGGTIQSGVNTFYVAEQFAVVESNEVPSWFIGGAIVSGGGGGSTPTGTGIPHIVGGVQNAAASLIVNADVDAAAAISVSKLAAGTNTYVLTTTAGVPVWAAPSGGSVPTGSGFYTITGGVADASASAAGTGVLTFLATPSSANLAAAVTDETGSGSLVFQTSPTFKTSVLINNPANTFAYTFTPAAILANRTITLPLLGGNDTMVTEAFAQTLTNKTISGASNTITNVSLTSGVTGTLPVANGGTGITSLGSGVATWLGTPSSANLAAAITDETGSGSLMFGTAPTVKTTLTIRNPADTFSYTITPAAIAATRVLNLPLLTGNDTLVAEAHTQTLTNKTIDAASNTLSNIVNANVSATAAIAGTKISPDFGSQLVQTSGDALATNILATGYFHTSGSPTPTTGQIRLENGHKISTRNGGNTANICIAQGSSGDFVFYGLNSSYTEQAYGVVLGATNFVWLAVNSSFYIRLTADEVRMGNPVVGDDTVYASHGAVDSAMTDANYTVPASEYKYYTIKFSCVGATTRTVTFPHPSSLARSYTKQIIGSTEKILTISTGTGTTVNLYLNKSRIFEFTNGGVRAVGPEY